MRVRQTSVRPSQTQPAAANMSGARRKISSSKRGRPPQIPSRRSPSPHYLEGCYERGHIDGLCEGVYDKGRLDGYNEGMTRTSGMRSQTMRIRDKSGQRFDEDGKIVDHHIRETLMTAPTAVDHRSLNSLTTAMMKTMARRDESRFTRRSLRWKKNWESLENRMTRRINPTPQTD